MEKNYKSVFDEDLDGYILIFDDGKIAQTQFFTESNRFYADFGNKYLERCSEYDSDLSENQEAEADLFVDLKNQQISENL